MIRRAVSGCAKVSYEVLGPRHLLQLDFACLDKCLVERLAKARTIRPRLAHPCDDDSTRLVFRPGGRSFEFTSLEAKLDHILSKDVLKA